MSEVKAMRRLAVVGLLVSSAVLVAQGPPGGPGFGRGPGGGRGMGMMGGASPYVTGAPFSAVQVVQTQESLMDGNTITKKYQTNLARDGQGRVRTEETISGRPGSGEAAHTIVTILDYVAQTRYVLDSKTMTAYQAPLRTPLAMGGGRTGERSLVPRGGRNGQDNSPNIARTTLSPQVVNGVLASGTNHVETIPAGQIGNERPIQISRQAWVSNELKVPVQIRSSDPRFGVTVMELTNIVMAEPNGSLFVVPAGYTVKQGRGGPGFGGAVFGGSGAGLQERGPRPAKP